MTAQTTASPDGEGAPEIDGVVATVVAELLEVPEVGMDQNFFQLGGSSMLGAQLIVELEDRFGIELSLRYLFDHPTPAELAAEVARQTAADRAAEMPTR